VNAAVDVGVVVFVKVAYGVDYLFRLLRGCSVVKIDERVIVYFSF
jgi:hypothetical protein